MMVHQGAKLEFWIGLSTNSFSTPATGIPEDISSTVNPFCQKNLSGAVDADFKTSLSGIVGQANQAIRSGSVMSVYWFQTAHDMRSQGQLSLTKWQLHAWCLRIHPWGCRWLQCQNVFGEQFHSLIPYSEIFRQFSDSYCASLVAFAKHLDWTLPNSQMVWNRDKRDPTLSWGQRGRHKMTQMPDSLSNSICFNSQQMVAVDSLFRTYNHQRINHVVFQWHKKVPRLLHCPTLSYTVLHIHGFRLGS